jgi:isopentenyldiphosphate isomerase
MRTCRVCGCTDEDCSVCIKRTGFACSWVEHDLCSACATPAQEEAARQAELRLIAQELGITVEEADEIDRGR